jgi:signal transduction histidine kinase
MWLPAIDAKTINLIANYSEEIDGNIFFKADQNITSYALGATLPGHNWEHKKIERFYNIDGNWITKRKIAAKKAGIKATAEIPLIDANKVIGVLLLGTRKTKHTLTSFSRISRKLELIIGAELSRKKIEIELVTNSPIYDENNILTGIISISSDITEKVKNEELIKQHTFELERSNKELEQFAFVTSHDLQEPLQMISSFMEQLKRKYGEQLNEKALQYIYFATDGAKRMKQIILDLLEYSKESKPTEGKEEVNINRIISEFKLLRRKIISETKATLNSNDMPIIHNYKAAKTQIFHCLLDNALKYSKENVNPVLEISVKENKKEWEFSVNDNGIGIDKEYYDKIFIIFQRLHSKDKYSGTGIGLSIVKRHIEFLGGRIWIKSVINNGTTFYFTIPKIKE